MVESDGRQTVIPDSLKNDTEEFFIPGQVPSSKNNRTPYKHKNAKRAILLDNPYVKKYEGYAKQYYQALAPLFRLFIEVRGLKKPYQIEFTFIRPNKKRFDYVGPLETVQDMMVKYKWIPDDKAEVMKPILADYKINKSQPGVMIRIF